MPKISKLILLSFVVFTDLRLSAPVAVYAQTPSISSDDSVQIKKLNEELRSLKVELDERDLRMAEILKKVFERIHEQNERIDKLCHSTPSGCNLGLGSSKGDSKSGDAEAKRSGD